MNDILSIRLIVSGKVQGVFFRQSTCEKAKALGLTGFVMNCDNGSVLIEAHGPSEKIEALFIWSQRGPILANVNSVEREEIPSITLDGNFIFRK